MKKALLALFFSVFFLPVIAQQYGQQNRAKADSIQAVFKARIDSIKQSNTLGNKPNEGLQKMDSNRTAMISKIDSLRQSIPGDSLAQAGLRKVDSVQSAFYKSVDSLQSAYQQPLNELNADSTKLQHKIDSLENLKLPTTALTRKLDSLQNLRSQQTAKLNKGIDDLKSKAMKPLKEVTLPPQM